MILGVGFFWPFHGTNGVQGAATMLVILLLLSSVPALWYLLRQRAGTRVAGRKLGLGSSAVGNRRANNEILLAGIIFEQGLEGCQQTHEQSDFLRLAKSS